MAIETRISGEAYERLALAEQTENGSCAMGFCVRSRG
jgi:hypothetical protein